MREARLRETKVKINNIALTGVMLALTIALSFAEHSLPPLPFAPPGVQMGLSNIVVMHVLFFSGKRQALGLAFAKSMFAALLRGAMAGLLSFCGGIISILTMIILIAFFKENISFLMLSIFAAIMHNVGQVCVASIILGTPKIWYYLPMLIIAGVVMGSVTGTLLRAVMPVFKRTFSVMQGESKRR